MTVKLENCMVSSFQTSAAHAGRGTGGDRPTESLSINFTKIMVDYKPQGSPALVGDPHAPSRALAPQGAAQTTAPKN